MDDEDYEEDYDVSDEIDLDLDMTNEEAKRIALKDIKNDRRYSNSRNNTTPGKAS